MPPAYDGMAKEMLVVLMADHGVISKYCDQRSPMLHFLTPRSLLKAQPDLAASLRSNWDKVTSPLDMFATLRHFARLGKNDNKIFDAFEELRKNGQRRIQTSPSAAYHQSVHVIDMRESFRPTSLFDKMPDGRGCKNAGIDPATCGVAVAQHTFGLVCVQEDQLCDVSRQSFSHAVFQMKKTAPLLCESVTGSFVPSLMNALNLYHAASNGICEDLTFKHLELFDILGGVWRLRAVMKEGSPPRVFDFVFNVEVGNLRMSDLAVVQVTRYKKYEKCTPDGVPPGFCVCSIPSA